MLLCRAVEAKWITQQPSLWHASRQQELHDSNVSKGNKSVSHQGMALL